MKREKNRDEKFREIGEGGREGGRGRKQKRESEAGRERRKHNRDGKKTSGWELKEEVGKK